MRVELGWGTPTDRSERLTQRSLRWEVPALPELGPRVVRRWQHLATWMPPETVVLCRHREIGGARRLHLPTRRAPAGYELEWDLGFLHRHGQTGTRRLDERDGGYALNDDASIVDDETEVLGFVEQAPLPLLDVLERKRLPATGREVLVAGVDDPLRDTTEPLGVLGWIESFPIQPRRIPEPKALWGLEPLVRIPDRGRWRHAYAVGSDRTAPESVALGGVLRSGGPGFVALSQDSDGRLTAESLEQAPAGARLRDVARWTGAPLTWQRRLSAAALRASASRARHAAQAVVARGSAGDRSGLLGWLRREPAPGWSPLYLGVHPVLGDHFATRSELEALDLGYRVGGVLGHVSDACASREPSEQPHELLWGSRFGHARRFVEGPVERPREP